MVEGMEKQVNGEVDTEMGGCSEGEDWVGGAGEYQCSEGCKGVMGQGKDGVV